MPRTARAFALLILLTIAISAHAADYDLTFAYATDDVFLDGRGERDIPAEGLSIQGARGEYESVQCIVAPRDEDLAGVRVEFSDLKSAQGASLSAAEMSWRQVGYLFCKESTRYKGDGEGWYPDPLLEPAKCDVATGDHQSLWLTVHVPYDQAPGKYTGTVRILADNAPALPVPLTVTVWPITLPTRSSLPTAVAVGLRPEDAPWVGDKAEWFINHEQGPEFRKMHYDFFLKYRISPDFIYLREPRPLDEVRYLLEQGASSVCLLSPPDHNGGPRKEMPSQARIDAVLEALEPQVALARELDAMDRVYVYGIDEIRAETKPVQERWFRAIHERYPDLKTCQTANWLDLDVDCDIFCPLLSVYSAKINKPIREAGRTVWWYICCGPKHPYPNWFIEYPDIEARLIFWMTYQWGAEGFLYYATNNWRNGKGNKPPFPPGPRCEWNPQSWTDVNGDGCIYYPGENGPLATTRMENIRDGLEDYELFKMLDDKSGALQQDLMGASTPTGLGAQFCLQVIDKRDKYSRDSEQLRDARLGLAKALMDFDAPPRLAITAPGEKWLVYGERFTVKGVVDEGSSVTVNDLAATVRGNEFTCATPLEMGENLLTVTATAATGETKRQVFKLIRRDPGFTPPPIKADQTKPGALIDDFTANAGWRLFGPSGDTLDVAWTRVEGREALDVTHDYAARNKKRASVGRNIPTMGRENVGLQFWLWADGSGMPLTVELCEKDWPNWVAYLKLDWTGWKKVTLTWEDFTGGNHEYSRDEKPDWDTIFWLALNPQEQDGSFAIADLRFIVAK